MGSMNQGNWGHLLEALPAGAEEEQKLQKQDYENQQARNVTDKSNMSAQDAREQYNADTQKTNAAGGLNTGTPGQGLMQQGYQQTGQVFDPARRMVLSGLQHIGDAFKSVFQGRGQQGQTNPAAAPSGRGPVIFSNCARASDSRPCAPINGMRPYASAACAFINGMRPRASSPCAPYNPDRAVASAICALLKSNAACCFAGNP